MLHIAGKSFVSAYFADDKSKVELKINADFINFIDIFVNESDDIELIGEAVINGENESIVITDTEFIDGFYNEMMQEEGMDK